MDENKRARAMQAKDLQESGLQSFLLTWMTALDALWDAEGGEEYWKKAADWMEHAYWVYGQEADKPEQDFVQRILVAGYLYLAAREDRRNEEKSELGQ